MKNSRRDNNNTKDALIKLANKVLSDKFINSTPGDNFTKLKAKKLCLSKLQTLSKSSVKSISAAKKYITYAFLQTLNNLKKNNSKKITDKIIIEACSSVRDSRYLHKIFLMSGPEADMTVGFEDIMISTTYKILEKFKKDNNCFMSVDHVKNTFKTAFRNAVKDNTKYRFAEKRIRPEIDGLSLSNSQAPNMVERISVSELSRRIVNILRSDITDEQRVLAKSILVLCGISDDHKHDDFESYIKRHFGSEANYYYKIREFAEDFKDIKDDLELSLYSSKNAIESISLSFHGLHSFSRSHMTVLEGSKERIEPVFSFKPKDGLYTATMKSLDQSTNEWREVTLDKQKNIAIAKESLKKFYGLYENHSLYNINNCLPKGNSPSLKIPPLYIYKTNDDGTIDVKIEYFEKGAKKVYSSSGSKSKEDVKNTFYKKMAA